MIPFIASQEHLKKKETFSQSPSTISPCVSMPQAQPGFPVSLITTCLASWRDGLKYFRIREPFLGTPDQSPSWFFKFMGIISHVTVNQHLWCSAIQWWKWEQERQTQFSVITDFQWAHVVSAHLKFLSVLCQETVLKTYHKKSYCNTEITWNNNSEIWTFWWLCVIHHKLAVMSECYLISKSIYISYNMNTLNEGI